MPLIMRGPGVPAGRDRPRPGLEHRLRADAARRRQRQGRAARWTASRCCRRSATRASAPNARSRSRRSRRCSRATSRSTRWDRPYKGVRTDRYTYVVYKETGRAGALRPPHGPVRAAPTSPPTPPTRRSRRSSPASCAKLDRCKGRSCDVTAVRAAVLLAAGRGRARARRRRRPPAATLGHGLHDARYCEILALKGAPPDATAVVWNTIGLNDCPAAWWNALRRRRRSRRSSAPRLVVLNGPRHFLMDSANGRGRAACAPSTACSCAGSRRSRSAAPPTWPRRPTPTARSTAHNTWRWKRGRARSTSCVAPGRRHLRDAGLLADRRPPADARRPAPRSAAGSTCRRAGATASRRLRARR